MSIEITVRHLEVSEALQRFARDKAEKLMREFGSVEFVRIVLDKDGPFFIAEVVVQGGRHQSAESKHREADLMAAVSGAVDRAQTQIRRQIAKQHEVRP